MVVNKTTYGRLTTKRVSEILDSIRQKEEKEEVVELEAKDSTDEVVRDRAEL
jgi:hypothetical protein